VNPRWSTEHRWFAPRCRQPPTSKPPRRLTSEIRFAHRPPWSTHRDKASRHPDPHRRRPATTPHPTTSAPPVNQTPHRQCVTKLSANRDLRPTRVFLCHRGCYLCETPSQAGGREIWSGFAVLISCLVRGRLSFRHGLPREPRPSYRFLILCRGTSLTRPTAASTNSPRSRVHHHIHAARNKRVHSPSNCRSPGDSPPRSDGAWNYL